MQEREYREKIRSEAPRKEDGKIDWDKVPAIKRIIATGIGGAAITNAEGEVVGVRIALPAGYGTPSPGGVIYGKKKDKKK